jgi:hypothetical protein
MSNKNTESADIYQHYFDNKNYYITLMTVLLNTILFLIGYFVRYFIDRFHAKQSCESSSSS